MIKLFLFKLKIDSTTDRYLLRLFYNTDKLISKYF